MTLICCPERSVTKFRKKILIYFGTLEENILIGQLVLRMIFSRENSMFTLANLQNLCFVYTNVRLFLVFYFSLFENTVKGEYQIGRDRSSLKMEIWNAQRSLIREQNVERLPNFN